MKQQSDLSDGPGTLVLMKLATGLTVATLPIIDTPQMTFFPVRSVTALIWVSAAYSWQKRMARQLVLTSLFVFEPIVTPA